MPIFSIRIPIAVMLACWIGLGYIRNAGELVDAMRREITLALAGSTFLSAILLRDGETVAGPQPDREFQLRCFPCPPRAGLDP
jgi:hypothetical protein